MGPSGQRWSPITYLLSALIIMAGLPLAIYLVFNSLPAPLSLLQRCGTSSAGVHCDTAALAARLLPPVLCAYGKLPGTWVTDAPPGERWQLLSGGGSSSACRLRNLLSLYALPGSDIAQAQHPPGSEAAAAAVAAGAASAAVGADPAASGGAPQHRRKRLGFSRLLRQLAAAEEFLLDEERERQLHGLQALEQRERRAAVPGAARRALQQEGGSGALSSFDQDTYIHDPYTAEPNGPAVEQQFDQQQQLLEADAPDEYGLQYLDPASMSAQVQALQLELEEKHSLPQPGEQQAHSVGALPPAADGAGTHSGSGAAQQLRQQQQPPVRMLLLSDSVDRYVLQWLCDGLGGERITHAMRANHMTPEVGV